MTSKGVLNQRDSASRVSADGPETSHESIARLYREHNQALLRFLRLRVDSDQEAWEVAQEAYVRMLQLDSARAVSFLSSYLFRTAANIAIDRQRRKSLALRVAKPRRTMNPLLKPLPKPSRRCAKKSNSSAGSLTNCRPSAAKRSICIASMNSALRTLPRGSK